MSSSPGKADYVADGATVVTSLDDALTDEQVWVIGGGEIYPLALPHASVCEVTEIDLDIPPEDDDALAPMLDENWVAEDGDWQSSRTGLRYRFSTYRRR